MSDKQPISAITVVKSFFALLAIFGTLYGIDSYVGHKIDSRINDADFIARVASEVQPALIFDSQGSVLTDLGASEYIDNIVVTKKDSKESPAGFYEIVVKPKHHLRNAPILSVLGGFTIGYDSRRGGMHNWIYDVELCYVVGKWEDIRFRLDVVK